MKREIPRAGEASLAVPADEQFRLLVEHVVEYAIFLLDPLGRVASWNAGAERIKRYRPEEIVGRHFSIFYTPEDRAAGIPELALSSAEREGHFELQGWRVRRDGTRFWAEVSITALRGDGGELRGFAKVTRDGTRRRLREELLESQREILNRVKPGGPLAEALERIVGLVETQADGLAASLLFVDRMGRLRHVAGRGLPEGFVRAMSELEHRAPATTGVARRPGEPVYGFAAFPEEVRRGYAGLGQAFGLVAGESRTIVSSGGLALGMLTVYGRADEPRSGQSQLLELAVEVARVAIERAADAERLRQSEERFRLVAENVSDLVSLIDAEGRRIYVSPSHRPLLGDPEALIGTSGLAGIHPADLARAEEAREATFARGETRRVEFRRIVADGSTRIFDVVGSPVRDSLGRVAYAVLAARDVTEARASEQALREAADELRALSRRLVEVEESERRRIARELHDQVGQNLSALNISLDIALAGLRRSGQDVLVARLEDSISLVESTAAAIEQVIADLRPPLLEEYGLAAALERYAAEFSRRTGVRVRVDEQASELPALRADAATALFRIAQEALTNVAKHANAAEARVAVSGAPGEVALSVSDDGEGFAAPEKARGSRWGMTTMRERAQSVGGRLSVESVPGRGTTVRVSVPAD